MAVACPLTCSSLTDGQVYAALDEANLTCAGGGYWGVGVAGFSLGAGYSWMSGLYGLGVDNVIAATIVLADGSVKRCSATEEPELFFAIRGTSSNFGVRHAAASGPADRRQIATELVIRAHPPLGPVLVGALICARRRRSRTG